jgi:hypothetical protein
MAVARGLEKSDGGSQAIDAGVGPGHLNGWPVHLHGEHGHPPKLCRCHGQHTRPRPHIENAMKTPLLGKAAQRQKASEGTFVMPGAESRIRLHQQGYRTSRGRTLDVGPVQEEATGSDRRQASLALGHPIDLGERFDAVARRLDPRRHSGGGHTCLKLNIVRPRIEE